MSISKRTSLFLTAPILLSACSPIALVEDHIPDPNEEYVRDSYPKEIEGTFIGEFSGSIDILSEEGSYSLDIDLDDDYTFGTDDVVRFLYNKNDDQIKTITDYEILEKSERAASSDEKEEDDKSSIEPLEDEKNLPVWVEGNMNIENSFLNYIDENIAFYIIDGYAFDDDEVHQGEHKMIIEIFDSKPDITPERWRASEDLSHLSELEELSPGQTPNPELSGTEFIFRSVGEDKEETIFIKEIGESGYYYRSHIKHPFEEQISDQTAELWSMSSSVVFDEQDD